jgi:hypothetical protein
MVAYVHRVGIVCEDSVDQIYNTDPIYQCLNEKTQFIRYTIPTLCTYATMIWLSRSDIQYRFYLHMLPREDSVNQIYNTDRIYIYYHEKTQSIRYTIPILSTYVTKRRLSRSDIQYRLYLHMLPREDSVDQIYNTDPIYICYQAKTQSIRYTIPTLYTYVSTRRLSRSDIQLTPHLHILPSEDSVDQIYNTDPIYICYHEKTQSIRCTITGPIYIYYHEKTQSIRYTITGPIYIYYHAKTKSIRYTIPTISVFSW